MANNWKPNLYGGRTPQDDEFYFQKAPRLPGGIPLYEPRPYTPVDSTMGGVAPPVGSGGYMLNAPEYQVGPPANPVIFDPATVHEQVEQEQAGVPGAYPFGMDPNRLNILESALKNINRTGGSGGTARSFAAQMKGERKLAEEQASGYLQESSAIKDKETDLLKQKAAAYEGVVDARLNAERKIEEDREIHAQATTMAKKRMEEYDLLAKYHGADGIEDVKMAMDLTKSTDPQEVATGLKKLKDFESPRPELGGWEAALAVLLSGIGGAAAGVIGGPNYALGAFNKAIDRRYEEIKDKARSRKMDALQARDDFDLLERSFDTDQARILAFRAHQYETALSMAKKYDFKEAEVALERELLGNKMKLEQHLSNQFREDIRNQAQIQLGDRQVAVQEGRLGLDKAQMALNLLTPPPELAASGDRINGDLLWNPNVNPEMKKNVSEMSKHVDAMNRTKDLLIASDSFLKTLRELRSKGGLLNRYLEDWTPESKELRAALASHANLMAKQAKALDLQTGQGGGFNIESILKQVIGKPKDILAYWTDIEATVKQAMTMAIEGFQGRSGTVMVDPRLTKVWQDILDNAAKGQGGDQPDWVHKDPGKMEGLTIPPPHIGW